jgi:regulator of replication initiation timing
VAKLEQRVEDFLATIAERFSELESDMRAFAPMVRDVNDLKHQAMLALNEATRVREELADFRRSLEERAEVQRKERRADRWALVMAVLTSAGLVIGAIQVLGGFG